MKEISKYTQVYHDEVVFKSGLNISYISPFGSDFIEQANLIFPLPHPTENTFIDFSSLGEPFRQYICFKSPIKHTINTLDFLNSYINNNNLYSFIRVFSKPLLYTKSSETKLLVNNYDYDPYLKDLDTRASLYMNLASKELTPLETNF
jgi:hypothetical protein